MNKRFGAILAGLVIILSFVWLSLGQDWGNGTTQPVESSDPALLSDTGELVIYSTRRENYTKPLAEKFEQETGIKVNVLSGKETLVYKVLEEKNNVQADIFWSTDGGAMEYLRIQGALQPINSPMVLSLDPKYRAEDSSWFALAGRPRILMYNKDLITEAEMPKTLWELTDEKWRGKYMVTRGGNSSTVCQVASLRAVWGDEKTKEWVSGLAENAGAVVKDHGEIAQAVGAGEFAFGLVNDHFYQQQLAADKDNNVAAVYTDQRPGEVGTFVNYSGLALVKGAPNEKSAQLFIEFMLKPENQKIYVDVTYELPVNPDVAPPDLKGIVPLGQFKVMEMPLSKMGSAWQDSQKLIEEAGLDLN